MHQQHALADAGRPGTSRDIWMMQNLSSYVSGIKAAKEKARTSRA
jgi:hypothetical protein